MDYFYAPPANIKGKAVLIDGEEFAHMTHVMRKQEGDDIRVVDGTGNAYDVRLLSINKKQAHGLVQKSYRDHNEPGVSVTLAVAVLKNPSKYDFLVEKVTELGVKEIIPLKTDRTIPDHAKTDRWQKLALSAMKQSGRSFLPHVHGLTTLDAVVEQYSSFDIKVIAHEQKVRSVSGQNILNGTHRSILMLVGPEGGFSDDEVEQCMKAGFVPLYLGERRLRTETAAIVVSVLAIR